MSLLAFKILQPRIFIIQNSLIFDYKSISIYRISKQKDTFLLFLQIVYPSK